MQGKEACWVPGTDHASIATEAKVVAMLKRRDRERIAFKRKFLEYAWEWKEKYGGIILEQLKSLVRPVTGRGQSLLWMKIYQSL